MSALDKCVVKYVPHEFDWFRFKTQSMPVDEYTILWYYRLYAHMCKVWTFITVDHLMRWRPKFSLFLSTSD